MAVIKFSDEEKAVIGAFDELRHQLLSMRFVTDVNFSDRSVTTDNGMTGNRLAQCVGQLQVAYIEALKVQATGRATR